MLPDGFVQKMKTLLGAQFDAFCASYDRPRSAGVRRNPLKCENCAPFSQYLTGPVPWEPCGYYYDPSLRPGLDPLHEAGAYYLQEPSAMSAAPLLDAKPYETVLDLCAAPGGKASQLAAAMQGKGLLVANEIHPKRALILGQNLERLGVANALVLNETPKKLSGTFVSFFDKILVDAPCSGEGMFRKEEAAVTDWSEQTVQTCAKRQAEILDEAAKMLRPGGRLVYSTCTFSPEEDEASISEFLHRHPDFYAEDVCCPYFDAARPDWVRDAAGGIEKAFRLWPHKLRGEGHFAAVLRKSGEEQAALLPCESGVVMPPELAQFRRENELALPNEKLIAFGDTVFSVPQNLPQLRGLKVIFAGLQLGRIEKGRFTPAHAWAMWLKSAKSEHELNEEEAKNYLGGQVIAGGETGWTLMKYKGISLGWAKGSAGQLKNHYPKALRRP